MKINLQIKPKSDYTFRHVRPGETFIPVTKGAQMLCMKVRASGGKAAINLRTGQMLLLRPNTPVRQINTQVVVD